MPNAGSVWEDLLELMARLRDPQVGCPWDRRQTFVSIAPYTLEEAYEVLEAIERGQPAELQEELGDLLFQVIFHARMAEEAGWFDANDVVRGLVAKMVRRHPHVFGEARLTDEASLRAVWEEQKRFERAEKGAQDAQQSALDGVALALPALMRAIKLQKRAAHEGFDWPDASAVWPKIEEELVELREAMVSGEKRQIEEELGDVLFALTNLARKLGLDPEVALRASNAKFERRFRGMEALAAQRGLTLAHLTLAEQDALYAEIKRQEREGSDHPASPV